MRAATRRGRAVVTAVSIGIGFARSVLAQVPQGPPDASPPPDSTRTVNVTIVAGGDDAEPLMGTIRELLGRLGLAVDPHIVASAAELPSSADAPAGLSVRVDLASRYEAVTVVRHGNEEVRRTIPRDSSPAIVREEIGEAVRSGVEVQLLSEAARNAPLPTTAPLPAPSPAPSGPETSPASAASSRWFALDLTVLAGGGPIASGSEFVPRLGGGAVLGSRGRLRPSLTLTGEFIVPFHASVPGVVMTTTGVSLRAVPAIEVLHAAWLSLHLGAGVGLDVIAVDAPHASSNAPLSIPGASSRVDPILTALATAYAALTPGVAFTLAVGADIDLASPEYVVGGPGGGDILVPWPVRPIALAGLTFTAVGSPQFVARTP